MNPKEHAAASYTYPTAEPPFERKIFWRLSSEVCFAAMGYEVLGARSESDLVSDGFGQVT
jgi:hypothetical protein